MQIAECGIEEYGARNEIRNPQSEIYNEKGNCGLRNDDCGIEEMRILDCRLRNGRRSDCGVQIVE